MKNSIFGEFIDNTIDNLKIRKMNISEPFTFLLVCIFFLGLLVNESRAVTAYVTLPCYSCFTSRNSGPGELIIFRSSQPNAGNNYNSVAGRLTISGNITNVAVDLGSAGGYFTCVYNHKWWAQAIGCTTSPVDFSTSTSYLSGTQTFNIGITCSSSSGGGSLPPPTIQSAVSDTNGWYIAFTCNQYNS